VKRIEWVVKASKFCNLRCAYCYEWNSLADRRRMSVEDWRHVLDAVRTYHAVLEGRLGTSVESAVIWHGGEPLTLPVDYLDEVMTLQHQTLGDIRHQLLLQTNLYRVSDKVLDLLVRQDIGLGVSMDVVGGARLDLRGNRTENDVLANLDRLQHRGITHGAITVVARHNHRRLRDVHDFWASRGIGFRVLPLFQGPDERPNDLFEVTDDQLVVALSDLFDYWIEAGAVVPVLPLSQWLENVLQKLLGRPAPVYDRRLRGDSVLLVETNGDLFQSDERGQPELSLGNVIEESIDVILESSAYKASLLRTEEKTARFCHGCNHFGFCDGYPVHAEPFLRTDPFNATPAERCPVTAAVHDHIECYLLSAGYDEAGLMRLAGAPSETQPVPQR
jgi:uncharacterized protein